MNKFKIEIGFLSLVLLLSCVWGLIYFTDNPIHGKPLHFCVEMKYEDVTHSNLTLLPEDAGKKCFPSIESRDAHIEIMFDKYGYNVGDNIVKNAENGSFSHNLYK